MTRDELESIVIEFMDSLTTVTLACSLDNQPWAAAVYYARRSLDLVFFSSVRSRHSTVFAENSRAAATIHGTYTGWKEIKGLQMEGKVERITGTLERGRALAQYLKRFPFAGDFLSNPSGLSLSLADKMSRVALYAFKPSVILYMDNQSGFGTRWKREVEDGKTVGEAVSV